jgi:photosystem II stability/assembly factor-like uncharacterized protein
VTLLVATRKGAFIQRSDAARRTWSITGPIQLGCEINHMLADPRDPRRLLMASKTGHLGPTVFRSSDGGKSWKEAGKPPAFPRAPEGEKGKSVDKVFWLTVGPDNQPGSWYAASSPPGMFRSTDHGDTWEPMPGFNDRLLPRIQDKIGDVPGGALVHSLRLDPRDARRMYVGISTGGSFESADGGVTWTPLNKGVAAYFLPEGVHEYGHDPHTMSVHPANPDRLYQQNHCGIYRIDRPSDVWQRIGRNMPKSVGDVGFPIVVHPHDADTAWVFPMDGTDVWPRTSPGGKPAAYVTRNAGKTWKRLADGLPSSDAWFTVKRQAMAADERAPVGLYFGTTSGEIWASRNEGTRWSCIARHLPEIYAVEVAASGQ